MEKTVHAFIISRRQKQLTLVSSIIESRVIFHYSDFFRKFALKNESIKEKEMKLRLKKMVGLRMLGKLIESFVRMKVRKRLRCGLGRVKNKFEEEKKKEKALEKVLRKRDFYHKKKYFKIFLWKGNKIKEKEIEVEIGVMILTKIFKGKMIKYFSRQKHQQKNLPSSLISNPPMPTKTLQPKIIKNYVKRQIKKIS